MKLVIHLGEPFIMRTKFIIFTVRKSSCGKVMFSQASVILSGGGEIMHGRGVHAWQGACMAGGMHGRGHAWWGEGVPGVVHGGGMHGRGACMAGRCAWQVCAWQERRPLQRMHPTGMHSCQHINPHRLDLEQKLLPQLTQ